MKKLIFLILILATAGCAKKEDAPAPSSAPKPKGFSVDPDAVALFDRAAKLYSGCKTIRLRWKTAQKSSVLTVVTFAFARPARSYARIYYESGIDSVYVVDGNSSWMSQSDDLFGSTYSKEPVLKGDLADTLLHLNAAPGLGGVLFDWLQGQHQLQPAQIKEMLKSKQNVEVFEAKKLVAAQWKGRSWERVQVRYRLGASKDMPVRNSTRIFWLSPDNARLVKMEELNIKDEVVETHEIVEQTFNAAISASTFVFKIPKGAKKE